MELRKKVLVGLSGGVDSSVAAALLQEEGYDVEGAFIITWQAPWLPCTWREERRDAMRVAAQLHIPFHTIDLSKEYERDVVQYFVAEYAAGRTPNPDVMCNTYVKFGAFFEWAQNNGFDYVATGHYARVTCTEQGTYELRAGIDATKDQSYFLWTLTQAHLAHTLFPIGVYKKTEVRALAARFNLPTAQKKDSQGICFLGKVDMQEFLSHYIPPKLGTVVDAQGHGIGTHAGAAYYTLGQRHGFTVQQKTPNATPLYVVAKDMDANTVTVAPKGHKVSESLPQRIVLRDVSLRTPLTAGRVRYQARLRYRQPLFDVQVVWDDAGSIVVSPDTAQEYVPQGQSMVLYDGDVCLGGGVIA
jgi:tRNA-uridine 2-sulfurtransferase